MKLLLNSRVLILALLGTMLAGCASQERRTGRVERRQDHVDYRTGHRLDRQEIRSEREDARAAARFDSW